MVIAIKLTQRQNLNIKMAALHPCHFFMPASFFLTFAISRITQQSIARDQ
ncbi:hypothetical protein GLIP_0134 [Aliiglaciecola lipolytica E3]|uniref:Uncharacterized protein n=1 Tax=Aliiglaciecola lipolytica E3 TaxID=1127673 RepID=K6WWJ5_9ALTE|nr:hypothetical protein GLIP_0134 [Aliiglaciecola lipolytica E3]